jgi:hypothetical protein
MIFQDIGFDEEFFVGGKYHSSASHQASEPSKGEVFSWCHGVLSGSPNAQFHCLFNGSDCHTDCCSCDFLP